MGRGEGRWGGESGGGLERLTQKLFKRDPFTCSLWFLGILKGGGPWIGHCYCPHHMFSGGFAIVLFMWMRFMFVLITLFEAMLYTILALADRGYLGNIPVTYQHQNKLS